MTTRRIARVLLDSPLPQLDRLFDYEIPDELAPEAREGVRVRVPLRAAGRIVDGFIVELDDEPAADRPLSELESVISPVPVLPRRLYDLARKVADRSAGSASDILRLVVPRRMVRAERSWQNAERAAAPEVQASTAEWAAAGLASFPGLEESLSRGARIALTAPTTPVTPGSPAPGWVGVLAAASAQLLAAGRSSILVVPDHRDLDQLEQGLIAHGLGEAVIRTDAAQSAPARYGAYLRVLEPTPSIVIGNRSAVYAPVHALGLVAVWDDGDPLLREPLSPGVHARDAALVRQEQEQFALIFAGFTRTTDVQRLVDIGWVEELRAARPAAPRVVLTPLREGETGTARVPSAAFTAAREAVRSGPVLVQVSRPGYAPVLACADCRHPARCRACGGSLQAGARGATPTCSACGRRAEGWTCASCGGTRFLLIGSGSRRTAEELGRAFPGVRVIVSDAEHQVLDVPAAPALVIATRGAEPRTAGGYRAVLLLDGERMLLADDLRIAEHCLRWWSNAAALAAPGAPVHLVGVAGTLGRALATWTQPAFARAELAERAELRMPPAVRVAALEGARPAVETALAAVRTDVPRLRAGDILGPVPLPATDSRDDNVRALVRCDYHDGPDVARSLRAALVASALRGRRSRTRGGSRATLRIRMDLPDLNLEIQQ